MPLCKEESYAEVLRWLENTEIEYVPHGKRAGTKSYDRYEKYAAAKTVEEALRLGSKPLDLVHDFEKKLLKRVGGPIREKPLDVTVVDTTTLTKTDLILGRWGVYVKGLMCGGKEEVGQGGGEGGEDYAKRKLKASQAFCKARLSAKFGVKVDDMAKRVGWAESPSMVAARSKANVEAASILAEGRKVTDDDVLRVMRSWMIKKNADRVNVFPTDAKWVHSEVIGLLHCSGGRLLATLHTRSYPKFVELLTRWMKDNRPEGHTRDFPFTSIILNSAYCAKRHRDANNVGASVVKAFGNFEGGRLRYWQNDDKSRTLEGLQDVDATLHDVRQSTAVIDGNRAHAVEAFTGDERYSLVFFTSTKYTTAPPEVRSPLEQLGFNFPDDEAYFQSLTPPPIGGAMKRKAGEKRRLGLLARFQRKRKAKAKQAASGGLLSRMLAIAAKRTEAAGSGGAGSASNAAVPLAAPPAASPAASAAAPPAAVAGSGTSPGSTPPAKRVVALQPGRSGEKSRGPKSARMATAAGPVSLNVPGLDLSSFGPLEGFRALVGVLSFAASDPEHASAAVTEYLRALAASGDGAEEAVRAALSLMEAPAMTDQALATAVAKAFDEKQPPKLVGEMLAAKALEGRQRKRGVSGPPLTVVCVAEALAGCQVDGKKVVDGADRVAPLLASSSTEGMETFFLIRCLQGRLGPGRDVVNRAAAKAMVLAAPSSECAMT